MNGREYSMTEPGFRFSLGKFDCIVFSDGTLVSEEVDEVFGLNCLFIDTGDHKILIDTGCGEGFQATAGHLVANMAAEGVGPSDIDRIIFTHGHIDHVVGAFDSRRRPVFPNAIYIASEKEWEHWLTPPGDNELQNMFFGPARRNLVPARDRFILVKDDVEVLPGIRFIAAPGHTPGIIMVEIASDAERLLCIGDIIHAEREFVQPDYLSAFDVTPAQALATRARVLSEVTRSGVFTFACHFAFPGLGYIRRINDVYTWQPL
jgi:glyoxylase-like metal-dependent hydrolase (beta-lactamase superfamily II)